MEKMIHVYFPRWAIILYGASALVLIPWIVQLARNLPARHVTGHWDLVWVGFDLIMLANLLVTLWLMFRRTVWVVVSASALATLFIIDAWFDTVASRPGKEQHQALFFGAVELVLAALTYRMVYLVVHNSTPEKNVKLAIRKDS